jgi:hypothetical protein
VRKDARQALEVRVLKWRIYIVETPFYELLVKGSRNEHRMGPNVMVESLKRLLRIRGGPGFKSRSEISYPEFFIVFRSSSR